MCKKLIITRADDSQKHFSDISHPLFKEYANDIGADFLVLDDTTIHPYDRIYAVKDLLNEYNRIIHLDTDIILQSPPNLFNLVDYNTIGGVNECVLSRKKPRNIEINNIKNFFGLNINWSDFYMNEGVLVFSDSHKDLFNPINGVYYKSDFAHTQGLFNLNIRLNNYKYIDLGYKWNHMSMFDDDTKDSFIIHYAGKKAFN